MPTFFENSLYKTQTKAISCTKQFCITSGKNALPAGQVLFQTPAFKLLSRELRTGDAFVHFLIRHSDLKSIQNQDSVLSHIAEYIHELSDRNLGYNGSSVYVCILGNTAFFIVKRISDFLFTQIFNFETAIDLLYYFQSCFHYLKLNRSEDQIILCGEIETDSQIVRLLSVYFSNVIVDQALPVNSIFQ